MAGIENESCGCGAYYFDLAAVRLLPGVIGRASERTRLHMLESHLHSHITPVTEFFRSHVTLHRRAARVWLEILADCHDVARDGAEIFH